jgi:hypothetical protein
MSQNENERENEKFDIKIKKSIKIYNKIKKRKIVNKYFFTKSQNWIKTALYARGKKQKALLQSAGSGRARPARKRPKKTISSGINTFL